jgi:uncharacterized protein (TIGR00730 family)
MSDSPHRPIKAYNNPEFLNSADARPLRILSEYLEPQRRFEEMSIKDTIVIFGSARIKSRETAEKALELARADGGDIAKAERDLEMSKYYEETRELAHRLTTWSKGLEGTDRRFVVCSGGGPGIMEAANRGASEAKGENIGLGISLPFEQSDNPYITRRLSLEFHYFFMRKFWFSYLAKAFVVMPGGFGTLDELFELLTLMQTFKIKKKIAVVLYGEEFWTKVFDFQPMIDFGTISPGDTELFFKTDSVDAAFDHVTKFLEEHCLEPDRSSDKGTPELTL